jgi:hypothetical protein
MVMALAVGFVEIGNLVHRGNVMVSLPHYAMAMHKRAYCQVIRFSIPAHISTMLKEVNCRKKID